MNLPRELRGKCKTSWQFSQAAKGRRHCLIWIWTSEKGGGGCKPVTMKTVGDWRRDDEERLLLLLKPRTQTTLSGPRF